MATKTIVSLMNDSTMSKEEETFAHLEPIPTKYGVTAILFTMFFFQMVNKLIISITGLNKSYNEISKEEWTQRNLLISWIHAFIVSVWDLLAFYLYWDEFTTDLIAFHNLCIFLVISFSTGYFLYDFVDILLFHGVFNHWEVLAHHVAVVSMFGYNVIASTCLPFTCVALLAEVNSFCLHSRKLLQLYKWPFEHWFYRFACMMNLLSFIPSRFCPLFVIYHGMLTQYHRVSPWYMAALGCSMFVMTGINIVLFWRLFNTDVLLPYFSSGRKKYKKLTAGANHSKENGATTSTNQIEQLKSCVNNGDVTKKQNGCVANGFIAHSKSD